MKKICTTLLVLVLVVIPMAVRASIPEFYPDRIQTVGTVRRVYFYLRQCDDGGACEWHYFGTDPQDAPPTTGDPVNEYAYVQFPQAFDDLGPESQSTMFDLAQWAGRYREGIGDIGIAAAFPDSYVDAGISRTFEFHMLAYDGTWYYFGSDPASIPPNPTGPVIEIASVQFPRDFSELGEREQDSLYEIGLQAGLGREGLIQ